MTAIPRRRAQSTIGSMSAVCPNRWIGTMARVFRVSATSSRAGSSVRESGSTSTKTGRPPAWVIASVVAMKVSGEVMTSGRSPVASRPAPIEALSEAPTAPPAEAPRGAPAGPIPAAISAKRSASVPLLTATACATPQKAANSRSSPSISGPPM
jgi:hypothetical protein